jgi:23S rRNA (uridine2552-2'-O)-methyltransferase
MQLSACWRCQPSAAAAAAPARRALLLPTPRRPCRRRWASSSSKAAWLASVKSDYHGNRAKRQGFRSRAAAKLEQLDDRFRLLRPGCTVVELGAAPGSWTQLAVQRVNASDATASRGKRGRVIAADINRMDPVPGATVLQLDLTEPRDISTLRSHLPASEDRCCNVLLSDMAPATTGQHALDHHRSMVLGSIALRLSRELLSPGGSAVVKLFQGGGERRLLQWAKQHFETARFAKPPGSKKKSKEVFLVATGFQPPPPS